MARDRTGFNDAVGHAVLAVIAIGCAARAPVGNAPAASADEDELWLYRDRTAVRRRIAVTAADAGLVTVPIAVPGDVGVGDIVVLDARAGDVRLQRVGATPEDPTGGELRMSLAATRAGTFVVELGYATAQLAWQASYAVALGPGDRATVRGSIALRNTTGVALRGRARVVDDALGSLRGRARDQLRRALTGRASEAAPRELGALELAPGEARTAPLTAGVRAIRRALVFDAIGPGLDHPGATPAGDPALGVRGQARIDESLEIVRDPADRGLPGGPARVTQGEAELGHGTMFDAGARLARADAIPLSAARGLTGRRERRDYSKDDDRRRFTEEFLITIASQRTAPVDVVVREHLYRGQTWTLAYHSAPAIKEGAQQIALAAAVPANGEAKVLYVVVYTW